MTTALLLANRLSPKGCSLLRRSSWHISTSPASGAELLKALDLFATAQGWVSSRNLSGGLTGRHLVEILVSLRVASIISDDICILSDQFFADLRHEPEEKQLLGPLSSLGMAVLAHLSPETST